MLHPDIQIVGMPKSGTSQMYQLLAKHKDVRALRKEWCPTLNSLQDNFDFSREVTKSIQELHAQHGPNIKTASACINPRLSAGIFDFLLKQSVQPLPNMRPLPNTPKFIYLLRDPADLLWASFNFWTVPSDSLENIPGRWTSKENFRTPEYFHVFLESEGRIKGSYNLTLGYLLEKYMLNWLDELISKAGRENVLVLRSSDLEGPNVDTFIERFAKQVGLSVEGFDQKVLRGRTNSGLAYDTRGAHNFVRNLTTTGVYEISGFRPMLPKTRAMIYDRARGFCKLLVSKYGVYLEDCLREAPVEALSAEGSWNIPGFLNDKLAGVSSSGPPRRRWIFIVGCCWFGALLFAGSAILKARAQKRGGSGRGGSGSRGPLLARVSYE